MARLEIKDQPSTSKVIEVGLEKCGKYVFVTLEGGPCRSFRLLRISPEGRIMFQEIGELHLRALEEAFGYRNSGLVEFGDIQP